MEEHHTESLEAGIRRAVEAYLPGRTVQSVRDRGTWVRRIVEVRLDEGTTLFFKMHAHDDWFDATKHEAEVVELFQEHNLPAAPILVADDSQEFLPYSYVIQEQVGGRRLGDLLEQVNEAEAQEIYKTLGRLYARMHAVHNAWSGLWVEIPNKPRPSDYLYKAEIVEGSGKQALESGRISPETYERAVALWGVNLPYLQEHQPSLVHYSPFPWSIYLEREGDGWRVTKLTSLGDVMWWDPAYDVTCLLYPPFMETTPGRQEAFLEGYGERPAQKRVLLYLVLQRLAAAMGSYMAPETPENRRWAEHAFDDLDEILDEIEARR